MNRVSHVYIAANLVFRDIIERFYDPAFKVWGEIPEHGTQIIRGENVVMLGEMVSF